MPRVKKTVATLRLFGDGLVPGEISQLLGGSPSSAHSKGDEISVGQGRTRSAKTGSWRLTSADSPEADLDAQIASILGQLTPDTAIWKSLTSRYRADIFVGVFMGTSNDGLALRPETLDMLGARGLALDFDIYNTGD